MSLDDLSISNISKGASIADNTEKEAAEWKFSDCLRLHLRDVLALKHFEKYFVFAGNDKIIFDEAALNI